MASQVEMEQACKQVAKVMRCIEEGKKNMILSEQELDTQTLSVYSGLAAPSAGVSPIGCCGSAAAYSHSHPHFKT